MPTPLSNHEPRLLPVIRPTLEADVGAWVVVLRPSLAA